MVFITETECVYCAVRTGYLNIICVVKGQHSLLFENGACYCLFHQHWATCCTHNDTVAMLTGFFCKRSVSKFCNPLRSSDLTLQDCLLWWVLITKVYRNKPHTVGDLKVNMQCEFINSDVERYKRC